MSDFTWRVLEGDVLDRLRDLDDASVQTVVTSPPYWGLRDYGTATWDGGDAACDHIAGPAVSATSTLGGGKQPDVVMPVRGGVCHCGARRIDSQLGLEPTPDEYVANMVEVFREVRRVLRDDGTVWLNLGDSYANGGVRGDTRSGFNDRYFGTENGGGKQAETPTQVPPATVPAGLKPKDLVGIPWRVAFALQADGWYLRSDIIWAKPNPMPESVTDRPTKAHEYVFLLSKSARYYFDADAVREGNHLSRPASDDGYAIPWQERPNNGATDGKGLGGYRFGSVEQGRNIRSVWNIATEPFPGAHFATFPKKLVEPCVKAGTSEKGCCAECGVPWERISERSIDESRPRARQNIIAPEVTKNGQGTNSQGSSTWGHYLKTETLGWEPGCDHGAWADQFRCPVHGAVPDAEITTKKTHLGCIDPDAGGETMLQRGHAAEPVSCTVLDPFAGSGTVGVVALRHGRSFVGIELNPDYAEMARERIRNDGPLFNVSAEVEL